MTGWSVLRIKISNVGSVYLKEGLIVKLMNNGLLVNLIGKGKSLRKL